MIKKLIDKLFDNFFGIGEKLVKIPKVIKVGETYILGTGPEYSATVVSIKDGWVQYYSQSNDPFFEYNDILRTKLHSMPLKKFEYIYDEQSTNW